MELGVRRAAGVSRRLAGLVGFGLLVYVVAPTTSFGLEAGAVFKQADPSIVVVLSEGSRAEEGSLGSGVIIAPREVVTNCHVLEKASKIGVVQGSVQRRARLRFRDEARDLCQIQLDDAFPAGKPVEQFVPSSELEVGQQVFAVGSPRGLEHTLTRGIISALRETKTKTSRLIQTDAAISPGSSGGGLFDEEARLIGITTFGAKDSQGLNFAIPAEWIGELATRNHDRIENEAAAVGPPPVQPPAAAAQPPARSDLGWTRVGDRWKYRLNHQERGVGTVNVEILEVKGTRVTEQITLDGFRGFLKQRDVETRFDLTRFQTAVVFPGGYQLAEIAPYFPPETELKAGQRWDQIPGEFTIQPIGKRNLLSNAKVVGKEKVRVPAGEFEAWRVESVSDSANYNGNPVWIVCTFWYAPTMTRAVKISVTTKSGYAVGTTTETYELAAFERGK